MLLQQIMAICKNKYMQEGPSAVGHKRAALAEELIPLKKKKAAFEKRERARVCIATVPLNSNLTLARV